MRVPVCREPWIWIDCDDVYREAPLAYVVRMNAVMVRTAA